MNRFIWGNWRGETVLGNNGCPCLTEYSTTFKIDNVQFDAQFSDLSAVVYVYHDNRRVVKIDSKKIMITPDEAEKLIETELCKNSYFQDFVKQTLLGKLEFLKETLCQKLLANSEN